HRYAQKVRSTFATCYRQRITDGSLVAGILNPGLAVGIPVASFNTVKCLIHQRNATKTHELHDLGVCARTQGALIGFKSTTVVQLNLVGLKDATIFFGDCYVCTTHQFDEVTYAGSAFFRQERNVSFYE